MLSMHVPLCKVHLFPFLYEINSKYVYSCAGLVLVLRFYYYYYYCN